MNASIPRPLIALVVIAVVIVLGYDGIQIGVLRLAASDDAKSAANAGATAYHERPNVELAYQAAEAVATSKGADISPANFSVTSDGHVTLTLSESTTTLVLGRVRSSLQHATSMSTAVWTS